MNTVLSACDVLHSFWPSVISGAIALYLLLFSITLWRFSFRTEKAGEKAQIRFFPGRDALIAAVTIFGLFSFLSLMGGAVDSLFPQETASRIREWTFRALPLFLLLSISSTVLALLTAGIRALTARGRK